MPARHIVLERCTESTSATPSKTNCDAKRPYPLTLTNLCGQRRTANQKNDTHHPQRSSSKHASDVRWHLGLGIAPSRTSTSPLPLTRKNSREAAEVEEVEPYQRASKYKSSACPAAVCVCSISSPTSTRSSEPPLRLSSRLRSSFPPAHPPPNRRDEGHRFTLGLGRCRPGYSCAAAGVSTCIPARDHSASSGSQDRA
jgi:hypothetical protein